MRKLFLIFEVVAMMALVVSCGSDQSQKDGFSGTTNGGSSVPVPSPTPVVNPSSSVQIPCEPISVVPDATSGGCRIRLVTPTPCEEVDLSNGKTYQVAWLTDGTFCETPYTLSFAGNPFVGETDHNVIHFSLSENVGQISRKVGGFVNINADTLKPLQSESGVYHWMVRSYYGSHPASAVFRVKK